MEENKMKLDLEEEMILSNFNEGKLNQSKKKKTLLDEAKAAADEYQVKSERINIRLSRFDLDHIKRVAAQEGLPYQTFIASVLHRYTMGYIKNKTL